MSLGNGREFLAIPGPTTVPDRVLQAMQRPVIDIYQGELVRLTDTIRADLRRVFRTTGRAYVYIANGHGAWQGALANTFSAGDKALVLESGRFAVGWGEMGKTMGIEIEVLYGRPRRAVDPKAVEARLKADASGEIKAVLVVQIDTASGVVNDIPAIRAAIDAAGHGALLMVDCIASLACMPYEMDAWGVDLSVGGCQKGLMTPPGLSYVAAGERAWEAHQKAGLATSYWDWTAREGEPHYAKYAGTPPVHMIYAQREALNMIFEEGLEHIWARHRVLAKATRAAVSVWAEGGAFDFNITEPSERSASVTTLLMTDQKSPEPLRAICRDHLGVLLGLGIGLEDEEQFRIAHMGHCNAPMMLGVLGVVEAGMAAIGMAHGKGGVTAAAAVIGEAAQEVLAEESTRAA